MSKVNHPWAVRSREFAKHLNDVSPEERKRIKEAERTYLDKRGDRNSAEVRAVYDFSGIMMGLREEFTDYDEFDYR
jgi:hypothetical protein